MARHHNLSNCSRFLSRFLLAELHRTLWQLDHLRSRRSPNSQHSPKYSSLSNSSNPKYNFPSKFYLAELLQSSHLLCSRSNRFLRPKYSSNNKFPLDKIQWQ